MTQAPPEKPRHNQEPGSEVAKLRMENAQLRHQRTMLGKKDAIIAMLRKDMSQISKELAYHKSLWDEDVLARGGDARYMHSQSVINAVMANKKLVPHITHHSVEQLEYMYRRAEDAVRRDGSRLFYENGDPRPGNRARLTVRQSVFVSVTRKAGDLRQADFVMLLGVSQSTVSQCIAYIDPILEGVLPTAKRVQEAVRDAATEDELEELVPDGTITPDGTETPIQRPGNYDVQKEYYSGKKKRHTVKNTIIVNKEQLILYAGRAHPGKIHDLKMLQEDDPDLGIITQTLKSADEPPKEIQILVFSDMGYKKIQEMYPGGTHKQPHKRPKDGRLTNRQKQDNKSIGRRRVHVEHAIGKLKRYRILGRPFDGTIEEFDLAMSVITGLANLKTLWNHKKKKPRREF